MKIKVVNIELMKEVVSMARAGAFVRLPVAALKDDRLSRSALLVLATIIDRTSEEGICELSASQISKASAVSERSVSRAVNQLEEYDYITIIRKSGQKNKIIHNDILPAKRRSGIRAGADEQKEVEFETALELWAEAGILTPV